jgi:uncharacterized protein (TIGR02996 family)
VTDDDFVAAIRADPEDDAERLVYADWLLQRGDPRGELIHVQCALAAGRTDIALRDRERELLDQHAAAWLGPWHEHARRWVFRRGFLEELAIAPVAFLSHPEVARGALLRSLAFEWHIDDLERDDDALAVIAALPALDGVERIEVSNHHVGPAALRALARLPRLRGLALRDTDTGDDGVAELVAAPGFAALESLALTSNRLTDDGASSLADWPRFAALRALDLSSIDISHPTCNDLGDLGALAVAAAAGRLTHLDLGENTAVGDSTVVAMAGLPQLATLTSLALAYTAITNRGAAALASSPHVGGLEHLDLGHTEIDERVLAELFAMPRLRSLPLNGTAISRPGLELLLTPACRLVTTDLRFGAMPVPDDLVAQLRARFPGVLVLDD